MGAYHDGPVWSNVVSSEVWTVEIHGPEGIKIVEVPDEAAKRYVGADDYVSAAWLAGWALQKAATDGA
jgi:hypothetical protein